SITVALQPYVIQITLVFRGADCLQQVGALGRGVFNFNLPRTPGKHKKAGALSLRLLDSTAEPRRRVGPRDSSCAASRQAHPEDLCPAEPECPARVLCWRGSQ